MASKNQIAVAYIRDGQKMIEIAPHQTLNYRAAIRLGFIEPPPITRCLVNRKRPCPRCGRTV